jgi:hypothetical protein
VQELSVYQNASLPQCAVDLLATAVGSSCSSCWDNTGTGPCDGSAPPPVLCDFEATGPGVHQGWFYASSPWDLQALGGIQCVTLR